MHEKHTWHAPCCPAIVGQKNGTKKTQHENVRSGSPENHSVEAHSSQGALV